jgi:hypothetical protein
MTSPDEVNHIWVPDARQNSNLALKELPECCLAAALPAACRWAAAAIHAGSAAACAAVMLPVAEDGDVICVKCTQTLHSHLHARGQRKCVSTELNNTTRMKSTTQQE